MPKQEIHSSNNTNKSSPHQQFVANAMTMQQALETAYNDWNKQKSTPTNATITHHETNNQEEVSPTKNQLVSSLETVENEVAESDSTLNSKWTTEIPFYYGNPTVDLVKGFIHIYKDW